MHIRPERPTDIPGIRAVNLAAFETSTEADLVDALREQAEPIISLVADDDEAIVRIGGWLRLADEVVRREEGPRADRAA